jgi:hypothetical protein
MRGRNAPGSFINNNARRRRIRPAPAARINDIEASYMSNSFCCVGPIG